MKKYIVIALFMLQLSIANAQSLTAELKIPHTIEANKEFLVEVTVTKSDISGFMKYTQAIPKGYIATKVDTKGGAFTFTDTLVKIIWLAPPESDVFIFSYKLKVPQNDSAKSIFSAKIDYLVNRKHQFYVFENKVIDISKANETKLPPTPKTLEPEAVLTTIPDAIPIVSSEKISLVEAKKAIEAAPSVSVDKIYYSAQVGAYSKKVSLNGVKELREVKTNAGIIKYVSGKFDTYEEALKRVSELRNAGFKDAYVVKFINGKVVD